MSDDVSESSGVEYVWMCIACTYVCTYVRTYVYVFIVFLCCLFGVFVLFLSLFLCCLLLHTTFLPYLPLLWHTERLLAAQNPLSQADRPHQIFADAPPSHPVPPPENRPTQKAPERILQPHALPNMQPLIRPPPPLFSKPSLCALHSEHFRRDPLVGAGYFRQVPLVGAGCFRQVPLVGAGCFRQVPLVGAGYFRQVPLVGAGCCRQVTTMHAPVTAVFTSLCVYVLPPLHQLQVLPLLPCKG